MNDPTKKTPGRFQPGKSGNPKGRTPGTGEVAKLRAIIADRVPELLAVLVERALGGDVGAARLLLERAIAPLKAAEGAQSINLPDGTLTEQGRAVLAAVASGELAPGQGAQLLTAIGTLGKIAEFDELAARIAVLEAKQ